MEASESTPLLESSEESASLEETQPVGNKTIRHVAAPVPLSVLLILITELCERSTFYGLAGPLQNYIQNKPGDTLHRGALGTSSYYTSPDVPSCLRFCTLSSNFHGLQDLARQMRRALTFLLTFSVILRQFRAPFLPTSISAGTKP